MHESISAVNVLSINSTTILFRNILCCIDDVDTSAIIAGHIDHDLFEKALGYQFITVVTKPASSEIIQNAIGSLLDGVEVFEEESA